jgi:hypothetical protein
MLTRIPSGKKQSSIQVGGAKNSPADLSISSDLNRHLHRAEGIGG